MAPWWWFPCKPKHVGAVFLILKCFNNSTFFNVVCISWKLKCRTNCYMSLLHVLCSLLHGPMSTRSTHVWLTLVGNVIFFFWHLLFARRFPCAKLGLYRNLNVILVSLKGKTYTRAYFWLVQSSITSNAIDITCRLRISAIFLSVKMLPTECFCVSLN